MSSAVDALIPQLANYNPTGFAQQNQLRQQQMGLNAAQQQQMQQETALRQQQTQGAALQNQLVQQQITDQKAIGQAWRDWDSQADPMGETIIRSAVKNGATPASVMPIQQHFAQYQQALRTSEKTALENQKVKDDDYAGKMQAIIDAAPEQQEPLWQAHLADFAKDAPGEQIPPHFTAKDAKTFMNVHLLRSQQIENELKSRQAAEAAAKELQAKEETRKAKLTNDLLEKSQQGGDPAELTGGQHPIAAIGQGLPANDPTMVGLINMYNQGRKMPILENGLTRYPMSERAMETMSQYVKSIGEANNPQIRAGKVATAVQEAQATAPIKMATSLAEAKALRQGDNPALAGVPPAMSQGVANKALELDNSALAAKKATEDLGHFLDLAESGNKAAGSNLSMLGAESIQALNGIKRINSTEIAGYEGAGNLLDRIKGRIGKLVEGQPVPQDVMDDIRELHQTLGTSAYQQYVSGLSALNQRTGSKYAPIVEAPSIRKGAAPTPTGKGQKLTDPNIARQYLTKAGGDKEKARQLAKQDGWTF